MVTKKRLEWSRRAEHGLAAIYDYIAADNPAAAENVVRNLLDSAGKLARFPGIMNQPRQERGHSALLLIRHTNTMELCDSGLDPEPGINQHLRALCATEYRPLPVCGAIFYVPEQ